MSAWKRVALYFVASPIQYLTAQRIAENFEQGSRQVLVWYQPGISQIVRPEEWDAACYMQRPRFEPLPGLFGRMRRMRENIKQIAALVGQCNEIHIHSAVFDTEAINYFLRALPKSCGASVMRARLLPDGAASIRRDPMSTWQVAWQSLRKLRKLFAPELDYWCFSGDRYGSDAPFCDRVYVLPGLSHEYQAEKVVELPPLFGRFDVERIANSPKRALIIGQPLVNYGLITKADHDAVTNEIHRWLTEQGYEQVDYKGHPKDRNFEFSSQTDHFIEINEPLEIYLSHTYYSAVVGVHSTALLFAREIYPPATRVIGFGWDRLKFRSDDEKRGFHAAFSKAGIELL